MPNCSYLFSTTLFFSKQFISSIFESFSITITFEFSLCSGFLYLAPSRFSPFYLLFFLSSSLIAVMPHLAYFITLISFFFFFCTLIFHVIFSFFSA